VRRLAIVLLPFILAGCECPRETIAEAVSPSPSRRYTAVAYDRNCGVLGDFNMRLGLKETALYDMDEVMRADNLWYELRLEWLANDQLRVTFVCLKDAKGCGASDRYWTAQWKSQWRDVHITYAASDEVMRGLSPSDLRRLPFGSTVSK
jgi:hypothetical protein